MTSQEQTVSFAYDSSVLDGILPFDGSEDMEDETLKEEVMGMVEDEMEIFPPEKDYLAHIPYDFKSRAFSTQLIENEHSRIDNNSLNINNYVRNLETIEAPKNSDEIHSDEFKLWTECINKLKIKMEYRVRQSINLNILESHQMLAWEHYLKHLESLNTDLVEEIDQLNKSIEGVHLKKEAEQTKLAKSLRLLNEEWSSLKEKNTSLALIKS